MSEYTRLTKQQYYDLLVKCASDGTFPSIQDGACRYRTLNNKKCAFGILIPNEDYKPCFEGMTVSSLPHWLLTKIKPISMTYDDLSDVQRVHDIIAQEGWDSTRFVQTLNDLYCFEEMAQP